jgi:glucoside 3-dehydrogenase (cytochrome c) hitch-hiker subunit
MNRREAIGRLALIMGGAVIGADTFLSGSVLTGKRSRLELSKDELGLLDEIGETIIPATTTPGAKAAHIGAFMQMMVNDCYDDEHQAVFQAGLVQVETASKKRSGKSFRESSIAERTALLNQLDADERQYRAQKMKSDSAHYFSMLKQLTILGYFTSEVGCTKALRFVEVPGAYRGNEPYKKGDRAWFVPPGRSL